MLLEQYLKKIQYTKGDFRPKQDVVAGVFKKGNKVLMMDHVKFNFWTVPIGKVEPGQTIEQGLLQEMQEELNVTPTKYRKIHQFKRTYTRQGKKVELLAHMFLIQSWKGTIKNNEPKKHRSIKWMTKDEMAKYRLSDNAKEVLKLRII